MAFGCGAALSEVLNPSASGVTLTEEVTLELQDQALPEVLSALAEQTGWDFWAVDENPDARYTFRWIETPLSEVLNELALAVNRPWVAIDTTVCWAAPVRLLVPEVLHRPGKEPQIHPQTDFWRLERIDLTEELVGWIEALPEDLAVDLLRDGRIGTPAAWPPAARQRWQALLRRTGNAAYRPLATASALPDDTLFWCQPLGERERGAYAKQLEEMQGSLFGKRNRLAGLGERASRPAAPLRTVAEVVKWLDPQPERALYVKAPWQSLPLAVAVNRSLPTGDAVRALALALGADVRPIGNLTFLGPLRSEWVKQADAVSAEPGQPRFSAVAYDFRRLRERVFSGAMADYFIEPCEWVIRSHGDVWKLLLFERSP